MHPGRHHQTTTTPCDEARWLGFFNMGAQTAPAKQSRTSFVAALTSPTPTKVASPVLSTDSAAGFEFTFRRAPSVELSEDAQKIMAESREEAARIRAQLAALPTVPDTELDTGFENAIGRKIAKPKGKSGRFSDVHMSNFKKLDSIANHASAWRADPNRAKSQTSTTSLKRSPSKAELDQPATPTLKRSPSKASLGETTPHTLKRSSSKVELRRPALVTLKRSPSKPALRRLEPNPFISRTPVSDSIKAAAVRMQEDRPAAPPAKRVKHAKEDDAGTARSASPAVSTHDVKEPTLVRSKSGLLRPGFSSIMSPTKASLARVQNANSMSPLVRSATSSTLVVAEAEPRPAFQSALPRSKSMRDLKTVQTPVGTPVNAAPSPAPAKIATFNVTPVKAPKLLSSEDNTPKRIKSILRTPNRRYTRDPLKIAAGTHLATPPKQTNLYPSIPATEPAPKRVDFTNSTKDTSDRDAAKAASVEPEPVAYPDLGSSLGFDRRSTLAAIPMPGSFTFRSDKEMSFSSSKSTIRQVSTSNAGLSAFSPFVRAQSNSPSKRKLETVGEDWESGKENQNDDEQRPAKKARVFSASRSTPTTPVRKDASKSRLPVSRGKRSIGLTAARLSLLARPKRRS